MDNLLLCLILLLFACLLPYAFQITMFLLCFYIGFKLICKDLETEIALRNYLTEKLREFISKIKNE